MDGSPGRIEGAGAVVVGDQDLTSPSGAIL